MEAEVQPEVEGHEQSTNIDDYDNEQDDEQIDMD
jgi:hypothetical protein